MSSCHDSYERCMYVYMYVCVCVSGLCNNVLNLINGGQVNSALDVSIAELHGFAQKIQLGTFTAEYYVRDLTEPLSTMAALSLVDANIAALVEAGAVDNLAALLAGFPVDSEHAELFTHASKALLKISQTQPEVHRAVIESKAASVLSKAAVALSEEDELGIYKYITHHICVQILLRFYDMISQ